MSWQSFKRWLNQPTDNMGPGYVPRRPSSEDIRRIIREELQRHDDHKAIRAQRVAVTLDAKICENCGKVVPTFCDGRIYAVPEWTRRVCRGSDGDSFIDIDGMPLKFRIVRGHGQSWDVDLRLVDVSSQYEVER